MSAGRDVTLVFPAYNEASRLPALFEALTSSAAVDLERGGLRLREVVIVDDGSRDGTGALLAAAAARDPRIRALSPWDANRGKGAALKAGIEASSSELSLLVDIDLSTPLSDAPKLSAALRERGDPIAIGSRKLGGARVVAPRHRRLLGAGFNLAVRALTGLRFADTQSGFKLLETEVARELVREQIAQGFAFDVELLMRARLAGYGVVEVPVSYVHDDRSKLRVTSSSFEMARDVLRLWLRLSARRQSRPTDTPAGRRRPRLISAASARIGTDSAPFRPPACARDRAARRHGPAACGRGRSPAAGSG